MKHRGNILVLLCLALVGIPAARAAENPSGSRTEAGQPAKTRNVNVAQFEQLRTQTNAVVLDVRTPKEFAQGHIPGATNIDFLAPGFRERIESLDRSKTYLVHCAAGVRSAKACLQLESLNFQSPVNLEGGYSAWVKEAKQPPAKDAKP